MMVLAAVVAVAACVACVYAVFIGNTQKSPFFSLLTIAVAAYLVANYLEVISTTREAAELSVMLRFIAIPFMPTLWFLAMGEFCDRPVRSFRVLAALSVVPLAIVFLTQTWESNRLVISDILFQRYGDIGVAVIKGGPWNQYRLLYQTAVSMAGIILVAHSYAAGTRYFRKQAVFFLISALLPLFEFNTYYYKTPNFMIDVTPYCLGFVLVLVVLSLNAYGVHRFVSVLKDSIVDNMGEGIIVFDYNMVYIDSNRSMKSVFPQLAKVKLGTSLSEMQYLPLTADELRQSRTNQSFYRVGPDDDERRSYSLSISAVFQGHRLIGYTVIIHNVTALANAVTDLEKKAYIDPLTNVYNRRYFSERCSQEILRARRSGASLCLVMFDLDHFKKVNDVHGHLCGDYVLKTVAGLAMQTARRSDVVGRYGGEEFCLLLPDTDTNGGAVLAENLRKKIQEHRYVFNEVDIHVSASFGVTESITSDASETFDTMLKRADAKLYSAKEGGRNRVCA